MSNDEYGRDLRSYGRRRGRALSARQARLWQDVLPRVAAPCRHAQLTQPAALFAPDVEDVWLEIGFGAGEHLLWQAERHRHIGIIGCEPFQDGIVKVLSAICARGLTNIRVHADDARLLLRELPAGCIGRVFALFPDPWPKKRHWKRRLVSETTLELLAHIMRPNAELRLATDVAEYAEWMLLAVRREGSFRWTAEGAADWRERGADWPETRYEAKARRAGRRCSYLRFVNG